MYRLKTILKLMSSLLMVLSLLLLLPMLIAMIYKEPYHVYMAFAIPAIISLGCAVIFRLITHKHIVKVDLSTSMVLCIVAWVLISLVGAFPFILGLNKSFVDGFFESVSGFTTTGITVFEGLDEMSLAILFWRSLIQWLGGLGILTFFLFVTANSEGDNWQLFSAEGHKISSARPVPNVYRTIKIFWLLYGFYTALEVLILKLLGLSTYEAITHSLTTLSTGGFSNMMLQLPTMR